MPDIVGILKESREKKFLKKIETDPILAEVRMVTEIVLAEKKSEIIDEITSKIYDIGKRQAYFTAEEIANIKKDIKPIKGIDYFDGLPGKDGKDAEPVRVDEIVNEVLAQIPKPETIKGDKGDKPIAGIDFELPKDGSPDTPNDIADKLNTLEEKVDIKVIKGLKNILDKIRSAVRESKGERRIGGGGDIINYYDLSSQCNGVLKTFTVPTNRKIVGVFSTQFPISYRPLIDWTGSGTTSLALTSEVGVPETGQTLWILYVK
jgi:hypothetical protein